MSFLPPPRGAEHCLLAFLLLPPGEVGEDAVFVAAVFRCTLVANHLNPKAPILRLWKSWEGAILIGDALRTAAYPTTRGKRQVRGAPMK
jgi:hypothetical protein